MAKVMRKGSFETNSSSTHTLTLASDSSYYMDVLSDNNGVITVSPGEYGPTHVVISERDKISYLYTLILAKAGLSYGAEKLTDKEFQKKLNSTIAIRMLKSVLMNPKTLYKEKVKKPKNVVFARAKDFPYGYVSADHNLDCYYKILTGSEDAMRNFIFGERSQMEIVYRG